MDKIDKICYNIYNKTLQAVYQCRKEADTHAA